MNKILIAVAGVILLGSGIFFLVRHNKANSNIRPMMGQYSFGLSVCDEVPQELVERIAKKQIIETRDFSDNDSTGCFYVVNKEELEHILVQVDYRESENQRIGQQALGRTLQTDKAIGMDHFIAWQDDGQINAIYLVMAPKKFVRIDRTANAMDNTQLISLAAEVAKIIQYGEPFTQ